MTLPRVPAALLTMLVFCTLLSSTCFGQRKAYIPQFTLPVQNYAVIDLSGTTATSPVTKVALNDENQAAFGFGTGTDETGLHFPYSQYRTYVWKNGVLQAGQVLTTTEVIAQYAGTPTEPHTSTIIKSTMPDILLADGSVSTSIGDSWYLGDAASGLQTDTEKSRACAPSLDWTIGPLQPYYPDYLRPYDDKRHAEVAAMSEEAAPNAGRWVIGTAAAGVNGLDHDVQITWAKGPQNQALIFDAVNNYGGASPTLAASHLTLVPADLGQPTGVNAQGWIIGTHGTYGVGYLWKGALGFDEFGFDRPIGLNDQGQAVVETYAVIHDIYSYGYLWENQTLTSFADPAVIPDCVGWQYFVLQPTSLSNQVKPAPAAGPASPDTDATLHVLAYSERQDVEGYGYTVLTRDHRGKWDFANVAVPEGTAVESFWSINSSGVIAAIGNNGHALLLVPVQITSVSFDGTSYYRQLKSDDAATQYVAPQWADANQQAGIANWDADASNIKCRCI